VLGCIFAAAFLYTDNVFKSVCLLLFLASPFALINTVRAVWHIMNPPPFLETGDRTSTALPHGTTAVSGQELRSRVVWILFDEMDERLTFEDRPAGLQMPEFDRFRSSSAYLSHMLEAGGDTIPAVPSMITGRQVIATRELGPDRLLLSFEAGQPDIDLAEAPNLFQEAEKLGFRTAVAAWGIPYCRIFREGHRELLVV